MQLCVNTPSALSTTDNPEPRGRQHSEVEQRRKSQGRGRVTGSSRSWCVKGGGRQGVLSRARSEQRSVSWNLARGCHEWLGQEGRKEVEGQMKGAEVETMREWKEADKVDESWSKKWASGSFFLIFWDTTACKFLQYHWLWRDRVEVCRLCFWIILRLQKVPQSPSLPVLEGFLRGFI